MEDFGKYKIKEKIGMGGTASVYLAEHKGLDRDVILKIMSNDLFSHDIDYQRLFVEEAQIIAKLNHPNIVQVYDVHISDELTYIEMEFLSGGTLKERINDNKDFDPIKVIKEIALAIQYVFNRTGTIHRDIKPSNILFREDEKGLVSVLSDFGIAKTEDANTEFTNIGVIVGTPRYMSPEHLMGGALDQRSDLYSLGIILYEMLSGALFSRGQTPNILKNFKTPKLPLEHKKLQPILNKLSAPNPDKRYNNADELILALDKFRDYQPLRIHSKDTSDITSVFTRTLSKILGEDLAEPVKKPQYALYALVIAINMAGGAYVYFDGTKKDEQKILDVEQLEISLLRLQQKEIDANMLNEEYKVIRKKYPSDKKVNSIGEKISRASEKQRRRSLLDNASKLLLDKEFELSENQLSLVLKLSPSDIEKDEVSLIQDLIKKRKQKQKEKLINDKIATEKKIELEEIKAEEQQRSAINDSTSLEPNEKKILSKKNIKASVKYIAPKLSIAEIISNCHYHQVNAKNKSIKHCHSKPEGKHSYQNTDWNHTHAAIPRCTNSMSHSHKYKDKKHTHKYRCDENQKDK